MTQKDLYLIDAYTGGVNMPTAAQAALQQFPRAYADDQGNISYEYVSLTGAQDGVNVLDYGAKGDGTTDDSVAFVNALASADVHVYVPEGTYLISAAVAGSVDDQVITFAPGAIVKITPGSGSLTFSGARQRIEGLNVLMASSSSSTFTAVLVSGTNAIVIRPQISITDDVANCTLLKVQGEQSHLYDVKITSVGKAFKYGMHIVASGGGELQRVTINGFVADVGDDGADVTFGALLYLRGQLCRVCDLTIDAGGRAGFPDGVVIVDGHRNVLVNPKIWAQNAKYAIYRADGSEFFTVENGQLQGRNNGTYYADSEGIYTGHAAGHPKIYNTSINGWAHATGFHGTCDTPVFVGCVLANNETSGLLIDSQIAGLDWPVSGLSLIGCYGESQASGAAQIYVNVISGALRGGMMKGCFVSYKGGAMIKVGAGVTGSVGMTLDGNRISDAVGSQPVIDPAGASCSFYWGFNDTFNVTVQSSDDTKVFYYLDPKLDGLLVGTLGTSTANNHRVSMVTDLYTANFGNIAAGATVELNFAYAAAATITTAGLRATIDGTLGAKAAAGITFQWWINAAGSIHGCAHNRTGSTINSVSGGVRFELTIYG